MTVFAGHLAHHSDSTAWAEAFQAGVQAIQRYGGASKGDRTMLDALDPAVEAALAASGEAAVGTWPFRIGWSAADAGPWPLQQLRI